MYRITEKRSLNPTVTLMEIEAPYVAASARPGQFVILRVDENGERIPLTVAGYDRDKGTVRIIFQIVGATTSALNRKNVGDTIPDFAGPLGKPTEVAGLRKVCVVGGGVGCAIALPIAEELHRLGCEVHTVIGFRSKDLLILENEFAAVSDPMNTNGQTFVDYLSPAPGSTAESATWQMGLTHFTCGNKKMCVNNADGFPVASNLDVQVIDGPRLLGNGQYCCMVRCICDVTYQQVYGCGCCPNTCLQTEKVVATKCVPVANDNPVTVTPNGVLCDPVNVQCGCSTTNQCSLAVGFTLEQAATAATTDEEGN